MIRVIAVVEGQTEQGFIRELLAPWLGERGVSITARIVGRPGHKGGVGGYEQSRRDMLLLLKQEQATFVTTMFDFYGMPSSWPGRKEADASPLDKKARVIEEAIGADIAEELGTSFNPQRFLPYVQMHEFEALAFADVNSLASVVAPLTHYSTDRFIHVFQAIIDIAEHPEAINDNYETCPSRRIAQIAPGYNKLAHGLTITKRIGIETLTARCPHFASWVTRLEALGVSA